MDYFHIYSEFLNKHIDLKRPLSVVFDASNGASGLIAKLLSHPLLTITLINDTPDGAFPAHGPNPLLDGALVDVKKKVLEVKADLGVVFDGDADRAVFVDEKGEQVPAHVIALLLFKRLPPPYVVDEYVNTSLSHVAPDVAVVPSRIGHFYIKQHMREMGASFGAEHSGHYYYRDFFNVDAALFTAIEVLNTLSSIPSSLSEFVATYPKEFFFEKNVKITKTFKELEGDLRALFPDAKVSDRDGLTFIMKDSWINIRASNTEPLLRMVASATSLSEAEKLVERVITLV